MKTYVHIYLLLLVIIFAACEDPVQEITWDTSSIPQKLVVEGHLTNDSARHPIQLSLSDEYFLNKPADRITGASVRISTATDIYSYEAVAGKPGWYQAQTPFGGQPDTEYTLQIDLPEAVDGESSYTATAPFADGLRIDSLAAELMVNPFMEEDADSLIVALFVYGQDPGGVENHYKGKLFRNGTALSDTISDDFYFSDLDIGRDGEYGFLLFLSRDYLPGDTLGIELQCISEDYYEFIVGLERITSPGDPFGFSGPPANVVGNISDGKGLGYFYAGTSSYSETVIMESTE